MRAVSVDFESHKVETRDVAEPDGPGDSAVLFRIHQVGVCGTDREIAAVRLVLPPAGESFLTIGHEALGQVLECGRQVKGFERGDWVVPMVRRPCNPPCAPCRDGRADLCATGDYIERGIVRLHGYFTDLAVDESRYLVRVPPESCDVAILIEPMTAVEKAIETAQSAHLEYYCFDPPRALILGAGTIGILAALAMRERGFEVSVTSREERDHPRVQLLSAAGIPYIGTEDTWAADVVIEATGSAEALVTGAQSLARNGVMVTLGSPNATIPFPFRDLIIKNQSLIGSVNATPESFRQATSDLACFDRAVLRKMIHRVRFEDYESTLIGPLGPQPKMVHMME